MRIISQKRYSHSNWQMPTDPSGDPFIVALRLSFSAKRPTGGREEIIIFRSESGWADFVSIPVNHISDNFCVTGVAEEVFNVFEANGTSRLVLSRQRSASNCRCRLEVKRVWEDE